MFSGADSRVEDKLRQAPSLKISFLYILLKKRFLKSASQNTSHYLILHRTSYSYTHHRIVFNIKLGGILPSVAGNKYANRKKRSKPQWFWQFIVMGIFYVRCARRYTNLPTNLQKRKTQSRLAYIARSHS